MGGISKCIKATDTTVINLPQGVIIPRLHIWFHSYISTADDGRFSLNWYQFGIHLENVMTSITSKCNFTKQHDNCVYNFA